MSSLDFSSAALSPVIPTDLLGGGAVVTGATQADRIKQVSKAMEGIFASQLLAELGKGLGGAGDSQHSGLYQDFIQQVTSGSGFGLAKFIENSLTTAKHAPALHSSPTHVQGAR